VFGICPWKQEILLGLLGADLIGFHIQFHCNNFLETVDRFLESKINWDQFTVERQGQFTSVQPFPISVAQPVQTEELQERLTPAELRDKLLKKSGIAATYMGIGVDRIDYTKGILERFRAVKRFLEKYPEYVGKFTFVELGAPSRTHIKRYHDLIAELDETVDSINWMFQTREWKPIVFLKAHHSHSTINEYYRAADLCMVTSLHDGMNLVSKEFIVTRDDEDGVLILSQFAGAARELQDAIIVNPYDLEEMAEALRRSLTMNAKERRERMQQMRAVVRDRNVYRWAANIITSLSRLRMQKQ
jgi:trehalose 6-phosphate synthase